MPEGLKVSFSTNRVGARDRDSTQAFGARPRPSNIN